MIDTILTLYPLLTKTQAIELLYAMSQIYSNLMQKKSVNLDCSYIYSTAASKKRKTIDDNNEVDKDDDDDDDENAVLPRLIFINDEKINLSELTTTTTTTFDDFLQRLEFIARIICIISGNEVTIDRSHTNVLIFTNTALENFNPIHFRNISILLKLAADSVVLEKDLKIETFFNYMDFILFLIGESVYMEKDNNAENSEDENDATFDIKRISNKNTVMCDIKHQELLYRFYVKKEDPVSVERHLFALRMMYFYMNEGIQFYSLEELKNRNTKYDDDDDDAEKRRHQRRGDIKKSYKITNQQFVCYDNDITEILHWEY